MSSQRKMTVSRKDIARPPDGLQTFLDCLLSGRGNCAFTARGEVSFTNSRTCRTWVLNMAGIIATRGGGKSPKASRR